MTIYERVTSQVIQAIESGALTYRMPWHCRGDALSTPRNAISGRAYRGMNIVLLWATAEARGFSSGRWATYRQWSSAGAQVRKGERATQVLLWKQSDLPKDAKNNEREDRSSARSLIVRAFAVFNEDQVEGAPSSPPKVTVPELGTSSIFASIPATIRHGGDVACYDLTSDEVRMPHLDQFRSLADYHSVLAHELVHWSGASHRLNRDLAGRFGGARYAMEELVAELGSAFLMASAGQSLEPRVDHAAYIAEWLKVLRQDPRAIVTAASKAQQAADYLLGLTEVQPSDIVSEPVLSSPESRGD